MDTHERIGGPLKADGAGLELEFRNDDRSLLAVYDNRQSITWYTKTGQRIALAVGVMPDVLPNRAEWLRTQSRTAASDSLAALNTAAGLKHWAVANKDTTVTVADEFVFRGHTKTVNVVAFSPNGNAVASGSNDTTAIVWDLDLGTWRRLACDIANRNLTRSEYDAYVRRNPEDYATRYIADPTCPGRLTEMLSKLPGGR